MSIPQYVLDSIKPFKDFSDLKLSIVKINPFGNTQFDFSGNNEIIFKLPRTGLLIGTESKLYASVKVDGDAASNDAIMSDVHTVFDRHVVEIGNQEVLREEQFGWFRSLEFDAKSSSSDRNSVSSTIMNIPPAEGTASGLYKKFCIPLASKWNNRGFFSTPKPLFNTDQFTLRYFINRNLAQYTTATTAATSLDVKDCFIECYILDSPQIRKLYQSTDIVDTFDTIYHYNAKVQSGSTSISTNIPVTYQNLRSLMMLQRESADVIDPNWETGTASLAYYKYTHALQLNSISKFNVDIDGRAVLDKDMELYPDYTELPTNLARAWNLDRLGDWHDQSTLDPTDGKGYIAVGFSPSLEGVSGQNLQNKSGSIVVRSNFNSALSANCDFDYFLMYSKYYKIGKDGSFSITK